MNSESFFENFELLAESPNAIQKLREMILQIAVQGKLVPQNPDDESAEVLFERIKAEKERLVKEGTIRKSKPLPAIEVDENDFELPVNWKWERLGNLVSLLGDGLHGTPDYSDKGDYFFINGNNLNDGKISIKNNTKRVSFDEYNKHKKTLNEKTVLVSINGTLGNVAFYSNENVILGKSACYFNLLGNINKHYLKLVIETQYFLDYAFENATGSTIKNVSLKSMRQFSVPLPPLEEQKRIVAKVDQLMALCDRLETFQQKKNESRIQLNNSALNKMLDAGSPEDFAEHWQLVCDNFDLLYDDQDTVENLKQAILQLAVQGKLVEQDERDEPAEALLEKIQAEKERLVKEGQIKSCNKSPTIKKSEIPHKIPTNWEWARLNDLCDIGTGSTPLKSQTEYYQNGIIPWITSSSTSLDFVEDAETYITQKAVDDYRLRVYPTGTLIIALYGQGKTRGQVAEIQIDATINQACAALVFIDSLELTKKYVNLVLKKQYAELRNLAAGGAQPNLNVGKIKNALIPVPPIEEQKRIVAKVHQLMTICNQLEEKIRQARHDSNILMGTTLKKLLGEG